MQEANDCFVLSRQYLPSRILSCCEFLQTMLPSTRTRSICRHLFYGTQYGQRRYKTSVSNVEVDKFSSFSKSWWDPQENPLIGMNSIRMQYITEQLSVDSTDSDIPGLPLVGKRILDVGCGGGLLSESLARRGANVVAIDPSETLVFSAKSHSLMDPRTRLIDYRPGCSVEELASTNVELFDCCCLLEVLEHISHPKSMLQAIESLLKPGGRLFLSTLNRTVTSKVVAIYGAEYLMRYLPVGTHDWQKFRSPEEVKDILSKHGLLEKDIRGMKPISIPKSGQWEWELDSSAAEVNWIATYQKRQIENLD